jgi:hypothetical protein
MILGDFNKVLGGGKCLKTVCKPPSALVDGRLPNSPKIPLPTGGLSEECFRSYLSIFPKAFCHTIFIYNSW